MTTVNNSVPNASSAKDRPRSSASAANTGDNSAAGTRASKTAACASSTTTSGQRDIKGSSRPRHNSSAVAKANSARMVEMTTIRRSTSAANAGSRHSPIQTAGASSTSNGRTRRPSKTRAPLQVSA